MSLRKEDLLQELQEASRLAATFFSAHLTLGAPPPLSARNNQKCMKHQRCRSGQRHSVVSMLTLVEVDGGVEVGLSRD